MNTVKTPAFEMTIVHQGREIRVTAEMIKKTLSKLAKDSSANCSKSALSVA